MKQVVIENPVINSPFDEPVRHFRFTDEGITAGSAAGNSSKFPTPGTPRTPSERRCPYANEESFYCRPLGTSRGQERMPVPEEVGDLRVAFLPPMSGLADREFVKQQGEIGVLIGQGQTAQVLRNLCYQIYENKSEYHILASLMPKDKLDHEIEEKLDAIVKVAKQTKPRSE